MFILPEKLKKLRELGLTEYQSRAYLALLEVGEATASQLSSISQVPRTRTYTTMNQLHEKGLVETKPETPIKYRAIPFEKYLERRISKLKEEAFNLESKKERLSKEFTVRCEEAPPRRGRFRVFYGRRNMMEALERMYESAEREILHLGTGNTPGRLTKAMMSLGKRLKKKGVNVKLVLPVNLGNREDVVRLQTFAEVRHTERTSIMPIVVVDSSQALMADLMKDNKNISLGDSVALWTNDEIIVRGLEEMISDIWIGAIEIERFDLEGMSVHNLMKWLLTLEMKTQDFIDRMVKQIGSEIGKDFKSRDIDGILDEIARYWDIHGLGKVRVTRKKPLEIVIENRLQYATTPNIGNPLCRITEGVLQRVMDEKLDVASSVREEECHGSGGCCAFRIDFGRKAVMEERNSVK
jgi:sugar-specific transcriptional regulator TrmB